MNKKVLVTGCAGFIGSNLVDELLLRNYKVLGIDNFSTGRIEFITNALKNDKFQFHKKDLLIDETSHLFKEVEVVFHLSANADVRNGINQTYKDIQQNTIVTHKVLENMRTNGCSEIVFSSTGSIYGDSRQFPTPEDTNFPIQTSLYGASKLACEGIIQAYCEGFKFKSWIFRFVSILGERYTHGHLYDFYKQLLENPKQLTILGNGKQQKSYLYVKDCINAIMMALDKSADQINIYNLGTDEFSEVNNSIRLIKDFLGIKPILNYTGGIKGWIGDNPKIYLDTKKIKELGWKPQLNINESINKTLNYFHSNKWLFKKHE